MESETSFDMEGTVFAADTSGKTETPQDGKDDGVREQTTNGEPDGKEEGGVQKHRIKYNGEERELTLEELKIAAQKGLNYDKVVGERDRLRASREFDVLNRCAAAAGMTRAQFLDRLENEGESAEVEELKSKGLPEDLAREHIRLRRESEKTRAERDRAEREKIRNQEMRARLSEFRELFPDVERLPESVVADIRKGTDIVVAYQKYEIDRLRRENAAEEKNERNRAKSVGSLSDTGASGGRYYSEEELELLQKNGGKRLMDDEVWEKAVRSMVFHQRKKKG